MTVPANLFIETPDIQDRSMTRLSNDVNEWPEEIIQKLRERIPYTSGMNTMVKFMKKDEASGSATGSVVINSADMAVVVPVIIKEYVMCPLDIMIARGKILPLTPDYFKELTVKNQVFDRIEEYPTYGGLGRFEDANLWNALYPPSLGRYAYASAGYPLLDELSETIDGSSLKEWILSNKEYYANFHKHGHAEILKKVAYLQPVNMNEFSQGSRNLLDRTIRMLRLEGPNKYSILSSNDKVFSPALDVVCREGAIKAISEISDDVNDDLNEVDQNGEKLVAAPAAADNVVLARTLPDAPERASEYDHYCVKTKNGMDVVGVVIPKVIDFEQKPINLKVFLGKTMATIQPEIWGVRLKNSDFKPKHSSPCVGQTGTFMFQPDQSHALCTIPITIKSVTNDQGEIKIKAMDLMGHPLKIKMCGGLDIKRITILGSEILIPKMMKWVVMDGFSEVSNSAESYLVKCASKVLTNSPVKVGYNGDDHYSMKGVNKYANEAKWDQSNLHKSQVSFLLTCLGASTEKIASTFKMAKLRGSAEVHGLKFIPLSSELDEKLASLREEMKKKASKIKRNLFKEASYIDNTQTVDALLSLNFVSPDNINKFVGKIPHFKATISNLASALLGSRLGIQEIPEEASSVAMGKLIEVVDGLERLRAAQEVQATQ